MKTAYYKVPWERMERINDRSNIFSNASYWSRDDSFGDVVLWHPCLVR